MRRIPDRHAAAPGGYACFPCIPDGEVEVLIGTMIIVDPRGICDKCKSILRAAQAGIGMCGANIGADPFLPHLGLTVSSFIPVYAATGIIIALRVVSAMHIRAFICAAAGDKDSK